MAIEDEEPFEDCVVCGGKRVVGSSVARARRYASMRTANVCTLPDALGVAPWQRQGRANIIGGATNGRSHLVLQANILGVDMCVAANARQQRAGRKADDDNVSYKVRGAFGEDKDDELMPETRWVKLSELVYNMDEQALASLDKWAGKLQKAAQAARKRLRATQEAARSWR